MSLVQKKPPFQAAWEGQLKGPLVRKKAEKYAKMEGAIRKTQWGGWQLWEPVLSILKVTRLTAFSYFNRSTSYVHLASCVFTWQMQKCRSRRTSSLQRNGINFSSRLGHLSYSLPLFQVFFSLRCGCWPSHILPINQYEQLSRLPTALVADCWDAVDLWQQAKRLL